jgi:hypothetical protein
MITIEQYQQKKERIIERLRNRAERKRQKVKGNDLSIFSEEKSGIPFGQPILVGHHSEKRHRKHIDRLNAKFENYIKENEKADKLENRADNMEVNASIKSDNPEAIKLLDEKIQTIKEQQIFMKEINKMIRKKCTESELKEFILKESKNITEEKAKKYAIELLSMQFGYQGFARYSFANLSAEARRLELKDSQIQVEFQGKPNEEIRHKLKTSPLCLKWSNFSKKWVRKHTATTCGRFFKETLKTVLSSENIY